MAKNSAQNLAAVLSLSCFCGMYLPCVPMTFPVADEVPVADE